MACSVNFSVAYCGRNDNMRHCDSKQHQDLIKAKTQNKKMSSFFGKKRNKWHRQAVMKVELLFAYHNIAFTVADH